MCIWWDTLCATGKLYGYHIRRTKTHLLVRQDLIDQAKDIFHGTGIQITTEGVRYLGSAVGKISFVHLFVEEKVAEWLKEMRELTGFARTELHATFATLTHGLRSKYT